MQTAFCPPQHIHIQKPFISITEIYSLWFPNPRLLMDVLIPTGFVIYKSRPYTYFDQSLTIVICIWNSPYSYFLNCDLPYLAFKSRKPTPFIWTEAFQPV